MMNNEKEKDAIDASKLDEILPKYEPLKLNGINLAQNYVSAFNTGMNIYQCVNQLQGYIEWVVKAVNDVVKLWNVQVGESIDESKAIVRETTTEQFNTEWTNKQPELIEQVNTLTTNQFNEDWGVLENRINTTLETQNTNIENIQNEQNELVTNTNNNINSQNTKINSIQTQQTNLASEQTNLANQQTTLSNRMDTFTSLSSGSTTGDAELQDIRVGANGVTYPNAGDAVRGQYSQLKEDLINLGKEINILDTVNLREDLYWDYTSGYGNTDVGTNYVFWDITETKKYKAIGRCGGNSSNHCFICARKKEGTFEVIAPIGDYRYGFEFEIDSSLYDIVYVTYVADYGIELTEIATNPYEEKFITFKDVTSELNWTKDYAYNYQSKSIVSDTGSIVCSLDINGGRHFKISGGTGGSSSFFATVVCIDKDGNICGTLRNGVYYTEEEYTLPIGTVRAWFTFAYNNAIMYKIMIEDTVKLSDAIEKSKWYGKSWISYGDSITQQQKWQGYVNKELGFSTFRNCGIGGTCISDTGENGFVLDSRLSSLNKTSDLIFVMGGTNDFGQSVPLGDLSYPFVETTFKGAIASLIVKLQNIMPNTKIVFGTQVSGDGGNVSGENITEVPTNSLGLTPEDYANAMIEACNYMSIPVIDVYHNCGINPFNRAKYIADTVHPNDRGGMMISKVVSKWLNNICPQDAIN